MTTEVEKAEQTLAGLQAKRAAAEARAAQIAEERKALGFKVHVDGDARARAKLDKLNAEAAALAGEIESLDGAIAQSATHVQQAQAAEACEQDRVNAEALREVVARIGERMKRADKHFAAAIDELNAANAELDQVHALGSAFPTGQQFAVNAIMALKTWLRLLPENWHREFIEALPPNQRRTFAAFWSRMEEPLESSIAARLGEPQKDEVAA